jgi:hypothetical protein
MKDSISQQQEGFKMKSQLMESELISLRSKIDDLEQKLGAHPSISHSSNTTSARRHTEDKGRKEERLS